MAVKETVERLLQHRAEYEHRKAWAFKTLAKYGLFISANDSKMFYGKASKLSEVENWNVDSKQQTSPLSVSPDFDVAQIKAADELEKNLAENVVPEVYEIVSSLENSYVINSKDFNLSLLKPDERKEVFYALNIIGNYPLTQLAPVTFEDRNYAKFVIDKISQLMAEKTDFSYLTIEDASSISSEIFGQQAGQFQMMVNDLVGAVNAKMMLVSSPSKMIDAFAENSKLSQITIVDNDGNEFVCPVNQDYIAAWLSNNNIIGVTSSEEQDNWLLFDIDNINTSKAHGEKLHRLISEYGEISAFVENLTSSKNVNQFLTMASPEEVMELVTENPQFKTLFDAPAGVWEGFSIGEHTETTLRVYEESFEQTLPKEIAPFVKMALVCHDIGKGVVRREEMDESTQYHANLFLDYYDVPEPIKRMLLFALGPAQKYTSQYYIRKDVKAEQMLKVEVEKLFYEIYGIDPTEGMVDGFVSMCKVIQACDSGAYTRYGVTRDEKREVYHKNGNDRFTMSFHKPTDLKKRGQRMIDPKQRI